MKQFKMSDRKEKSAGRPDQQSRATDSAFDKWLNRGLHELFDDVIKEPVPPDLLKLIEDDKSK